VAVFLLIRHGHNDSIGHRIVGRSSGIGLNRRGQEEAEILATRLAGIPLEAIYSSPLERCQETALPTSRRLGLPIQTLEALYEIDFGDWTGLSFAQLNKLSRWRQFNTFRSGTRIPGGELMAEVQARMVGGIEELRRQNPDGVMALFSHGDPIKTAIAHYAGFPLDLMLRYEISVASISIVDIRDSGPRILCINHTGAPLPLSL
jgi:broad specificity phosphatase PhoE